jgi:hypothetical protein
MRYTASQFILLGLEASAMSVLLTLPLRWFAIQIGASHPND